ncbi:MAG: hypothetical protein MHPSP_004097, partial [Paramarteilia canceri]
KSLETIINNAEIEVDTNNSSKIKVNEINQSNPNENDNTIFKKPKLFIVSSMSDKTKEEQVSENGKNSIKTEENDKVPADLPLPTLKTDI